MHTWFFHQIITYAVGSARYENTILITKQNDKLNTFQKGKKKQKQKQKNKHFFENLNQRVKTNEWIFDFPEQNRHDNTIKGTTLKNKTNNVRNQIKDKQKTKQKQKNKKK